MHTESIALVISLLSLVIAALSIGWQIAQYLLSAGRPKATLLHGLVSTSTAFTGPVGTDEKKRSIEGLLNQGISGVEAVGIQITNHGRAPVIIEKITLFPRGGTMSLVPLRELLGPDLPYKLEPGANSSWYVDYSHAIRLIASSREVLEENVSGVYMSAQLGTGKSIKTRQTLRA